MTPAALTAAIAAYYDLPYLNAHEADERFGRACGVHPDTVRRWRNRGPIPGYAVTVIEQLAELKAAREARMSSE